MCVCLRGDWTDKQVQIAHLSQDSSDSAYENLAVLCLSHHDEYDTKRSQSKGFSPDEVRCYKEFLVREIASKLPGPPPQPPESSPTLDDRGTHIDTEDVPPAPTITPPIGEIVPSDLVSALADPTRAQEAGRMLATSNLVSKEIGEIGHVVICAKTVAHFVILVADNIQWNWELVVFSNSMGKWTLFGRVPLACQRGGQPEVHYIPGSMSCALAVEHIAGTGTGCYLKSASWYRITPDGLVRLFGYPIYGYVVGWGMIFQRKFEGRVLKFSTFLDSGSLLEIAFNAEYRCWEYAAEEQSKYREMLLFNFEGRLVLEWSQDALAFLRRQESTMTFDDVRGLFDDGHEGFLVRHVDRIIGLIKHGGYLHRQWINELLDRCDETEAARAVKAAFAETAG